MIQTRQIIDQVFERLQEDPENCACIDCGDSSAIFVSLNYGCFICPLCVNQHTALGPGFVCKSILSNDWTVQELKKVVSGGNSALKEFLIHYDIHELPANDKYKTKAISVYKRMLNEIAHGRSFDEELPPIDVGKEIEGISNGGWFQEFVCKSKSFGNQALEQLENLKDKAVGKVEKLKIVSHIRNSSISVRTSEVLEHLTEDVQARFLDRTKRIKDETFLVLQNLENLIGCKTKVNT